jgi:NAD(P)-dependent dehydrogenase (short-subunit alcohol dehydrogenase family)
MSRKMTSYNPFSLEGKTILITGASSGIGRAISIECSKMGANVNIVGRDQVRLHDTYAQLDGNKHKLFLADLTSEKDIDSLVSGLEPLDGIVHSAGIIKRVPLKLITGGTYEELLKINLIAPAILTKKLYKAKLVKPEASIILISSVGSNIASLGNIMYMSSKGGMNSFMKGSALELASQGIRVNCIEPGMIRTNLTRGIPDEELIKDINRYPLGRYGQPEEVAYATIYLLSDASKWITGSSLKIDGGISLR